MVKTNAERQAEYKQRHLDGAAAKAVRLDTLISKDASDALARLMARHKATKREALEQALHLADKATHSLTEGDQA